MNITIRYRSIDRYSESRRFKTLKGAQKYAHKRVGEHPEVGSSYAVSGDGIGRITVEGCTLAELFPAPKDDPGDPGECRDEDWDQPFLGDYEDWSSC